MNKYFYNLLLILFSILLAFLVAEGLARVFFDPIDFLKPKRIYDENLGYRIEPNSGAHDEWGFRNESVPESADIVAVGDSQTYGFSATASNSWPSLLQRMSGKDVYNLSQGGYGPAEYLFLIENKALSLNPKMIIVGLYLGNDIKNTFNSVYTASIWEDYRNPDSEIEPEKVRHINSDWFDYGFSDWLRGNSVLYRIVSTSFIGDILRQKRRINEGQQIVMLDVEDSGIHTGLTPGIRLKVLDSTDVEIREGLGLTLKFFDKMNQIANQKGIDFMVVLIPTKESVYSNYIASTSDLPHSDELKRLIVNEEVVNKLVKAYFTDHNIKYVDTLEPLKNAAASEQLYPNNFSGHPNENGYRIIAESVNQYLGSINR